MAHLGGLEGQGGLWWLEKVLCQLRTFDHASKLASVKDKMMLTPQIRITTDEEGAQVKTQALASWVPQVPVLAGVCVLT